MASETDLVAATAIIDPNAANARISLTKLVNYYGFVTGFGTLADGSPANGSYQINSNAVKYFSVAVYTNDGSYIVGPDNVPHYYGNSLLDIPINQLGQYYFQPSGTANETTLIHFNAETSNTSYSRPAISAHLGNRDYQRNRLRRVL